MTISRSTPTNFEFVIPKLPFMAGADEVDGVTLHLFETVIPGQSVNFIEVMWMGVLARQDASHRKEYEDWTISFMVDANFDNWYKLWQWTNYISAGKGEAATDHIKPKMHGVTGSLNITDNFRNLILSIRFYDVWIANLGEVRMSKREGDMGIDCTATLKYSRYEVIRS